MITKTPKSVAVEHEALHADLVKLTLRRGKVDEAARMVAMLLHPHFEKEEEFALPPLGLLTEVAEGRMKPEMVEVLRQTDKLQAELPRMLEEHKLVLGALRRLTAAAKQEKQPEAVRFAEALKLHALGEEQILYPAALLVGECIKARLAKQSG
ncbi:MAG TPA: hemerythrin domain-containing protein [Candidatus Bathyarchaeia archaeon]|nr:hemerythrin domain-containing protein [Candidatus Bathyarchaeia archaeon]